MSAAEVVICFPLDRAARIADILYLSTSETAAIASLGDSMVAAPISNPEMRLSGRSSPAIGRDGCREPIIWYEIMERRLALFPIDATAMALETL